MNAEGIELITHRLERLERENRYYKSAGIALLVIVGGGVLMGQASQSYRVIEAAEFVVKGNDGKVRAVLGKRGHSVTAADYGLHLYAPSGRKIAGLHERTDTASGTGSMLELGDARSRSSASLIVTGGFADLSLVATEQTEESYKQESEQWAQKFKTAKTREEKEAILRRPLGPDGTHARLVAGPKFTSQLLLVRGRLTQQRGGLEFSLTEEGQSSLELIDENGVVRARLSNANLKRPAIGVIEQRPASSLVFFGKNAEVIWKAP